MTEPDKSAQRGSETGNGGTSTGRIDAWTILTTPIHPRQTIARHLRGKLLVGLITAIPLLITVLAVAFIYGLVTRFTQLPAEWLVRQYLGNPVPGSTAQGLRDYLVEPFFALLISLLIIYILGVLGSNVIGRRVLAAGEDFLSNLPLIKGIYGTTKQVIGVFRQSGGGAGFQRVVLVQFPRLGTWTVAFVTKTITDTAANKRYVCTFIPMTPIPTSGFFQMFSEDDVRETDWTVDQGIKIVLSGGLLAPSELRFDREKPAAS